MRCAVPFCNVRKGPQVTWGVRSQKAPKEGRGPPGRGKEGPDRSPAASGSWELTPGHGHLVKIQVDVRLELVPVSVFTKHFSKEIFKLVCGSVHFQTVTSAPRPTPSPGDGPLCCPSGCGWESVLMCPSVLPLGGRSSRAGAGVGGGWQKEREDVSLGPWMRNAACGLHCTSHSWSAGSPFLPRLTSRPLCYVSALGHLS